MFWLRQSTSVTVAFGPGLDITDGVTPETSLATAMDNASTGIRVSKNGGNLIDRNSGTAPVHDEVGWYGVNLSTADTDTLGALQILFSGATVNLPIWMEFMIVPANVWDSLFGADVLQTDVTQWLGTAAATPTVAGVPEVDVTHMAGGVQTVTDLKDFADAGYDPGTNKIQGVVLVDTTTDNSDMRGTDSAALASVATEARLAELDAGNLPTDIAAIPTTAMRGTDSAALASVATEARLAELDAANIPADIDAIPTTAMRGTDNSATASVLGAAVGASISADIAEVKAETALVVADTNELQADDYPTLIAAVQTVVDAIKTVTDLLPSSGALTDLPINITKVLGTALAESTGGRIAANLNTFWDNADAATAQTVDDVGSGGTVAANLTQILGTAIAETTSGNIGANFDEFFDNDNALTTKVVDDVGATVSGSGDATTANQTLILQRIAATSMLRSAVSVGGKLSIKAGDTYSVVDSTEIVLTITDVGAATYTEMSDAGVASISIGFRRNGGAVGEITGTIAKATLAQASDVTTAYIELPAAQTTGKGGENWNYDVQLLLSTGAKVTVLTGPAEFLEDNAS